MRYNYSFQLIKNSLTVDDEVCFERLIYTVKKSVSNTFFLDHSGNNDVIFNRLNIDKSTFVYSLLHYVGEGQFPECETLFDLTIVVRELLKAHERKLAIQNVGQEIVELYELEQKYQDIQNSCCAALAYDASLISGNTGSNDGGLIWEATQQGYDFWYNLIVNNKVIDNKFLKHENRLQKESTSLSGGDGFKASIICGKKNRSSVTIGSLSYRRVIGK